MLKIILGILAGCIVVLGVYFAETGGPTPNDATPTNTTVVSPATTRATGTSTATTTTNKQTKNMDTISQATLHTSMGDITIAFLPKQAPNTVANFIKLAQSGFYDGTKFHRVIKNFMDQGGDPLTKDDSKMAIWGTGGPGYQMSDEIGPTNSNLAGTIAMANSGPNTAGSQFFINAVDNPSLNSGYTVFGHVVAGMNVVLEINNTATDGRDRPLTPVVLTSVTLK